MFDLNNSGDRMRMHRYGLTVLKAVFAAVLVAQPIAASATTSEQGIDRQFIERRCGGKTNTILSAEEKKKVLELIWKDMQGLSASSEWNPGHPRWRDIEASYVTEFEWIATQSSQLNCAASARGADTLLRSYRSRLSEEEQSRSLSSTPPPWDENYLTRTQKWQG